MKRLCLLLVMVLFGLCSAMSQVSASEDTSEKRQDVLYVCDCGDECQCNSLDTEPGNCKCGQPMKWTHVVKVEGNEALLCTCSEGCTCAIDPKDPTKCGCGKPVKRVNLEGQGIYFCNCGGSCTCNTLSKHPGDCRCGMMLKKVE